MNLTTKLAAGAAFVAAAIPVISVGILAWLLVNSYLPLP